MKVVIFTIISLLAFSCEDTTPRNQTFTVAYKGALKNIMRKGDVSAKADLAEYEHTENLYALGAVGNLKGEIQIFDSQPYISSMEDGHIIFDTSYVKKATLLVSAQVKEWLSFQIPSDINEKKDLEKHIEKVARENNIDTNEPFPFLIEGNIQELDWHVINWKDGDTEHSHEKHIQSGLNGSMQQQAVILLGFYSDSHHAIFTHHTTNMHIHLKMKNGQIAGHVDDLKIGQDMILKLPKNE